MASSTVITRSTERRSGSGPWLDKLDPATRRLIIAAVAAMILMTAAAWVFAGRIGWPQLAHLMTFFTIFYLLSLSILYRLNPDVITARAKIHKGTKTWDLVWLAIYTLSTVASAIVAWLDVVVYRATTMSQWWEIPGYLLFGAGMALFTWAMAVNRFFEKTVRIQTDRGHQVIDRGPYAFVRHPGYSGAVLFHAAQCLVLGSRWVAYVSALMVVEVVVRTVLEDRTLREELPSYEDYARRVRYRLVPGIW
jgi:protein-S-isoprenylcysteine O-methyltransferase Ste14